MLWLVFWVVLAGVLSGGCSILEATFLSVQMPVLHLRAAAGSRGARTLLDLRRRRPADALSAILFVNTLALMVGATFAGAVAASLWGEPTVPWVSVAMTLLLLFVSEIGPKTYAASHAARLAEGVGLVLGGLLVLLAPLLPVFRAVTDALSGNEHVLTRRVLAALIALAPEEGVLGTDESDLIGHIVYMAQVTVRDIQTPLDMTVMLPDTAPASAFLADGEVMAFSRIPVYRGERPNVVGYVAQRDVLQHLAAGGASGDEVARFVHPLPRLLASLRVQEATRAMLGAHEAIALVVDGDGRVSGIVALEDLLETLTGIAITDEPPDASARPGADDRRHDRLAALRERRGRWVSGAHD
jgi:CBS domain containing-hemolysin-like protein